MKKITLTLILLLTLSTYITLTNNNLQQAKAQTAEIEYPIIEITSPKNNTINNKNSLPLTINITLGESTNTSLIAYMRYQTSWNTKNTTLFYFEGGFPRELMMQLAYPRKLETPINTLQQTINLTDIPEGNHNLTIYTQIWHYSAMEKIKDVFEYYYRYTDLTKEWLSGTVFFYTDTTIPQVTFSSLENKTYTSSSLTLNCTISEKVSQLSYSLDEQEPILSSVLEINNEYGFSVVGKPLLANLTDGEHSIVFYATDEAGNVGVSETLYFIVDTPDPFPSTLVIASAAIVIIGGLGLLAYFKKYRKSN